MADLERSRIGRAASRLWQSRWLLGAGVAAVLTVYSFAAETVSILPLVLVALFIVAAAWPTGAEKTSAGSIRTPDTDALKALSGEYLAAAIADPLIVFDTAATIVHANAAAISTFRLSPGMSLPLKFRTPEMQGLMERVLSGKIEAGSIDIAERLPVERAYRASVSTVGHDTALYVLVFKDQSEARRIERMRADFIANASHEMRTPLASISGFIDTLRGPARDDPAAREQFLQIMQSQAVRMARLIDDMLSLSRLEIKPYSMAGAAVDLRDVLDSVIASLAPLAGDNGIVIERDFVDGAMEVSGARDELFQVFENLMENACKYGQSGGRVIVSMMHADDGPDPEIQEIKVTIRDFGPGIAEEHIPRITERFYRVETDGTQKGTGLGLAIVKHILTRHDGRLSIRSEPGKGAAFTVHLPAHIAHGAGSL